MPAVVHGQSLMDVLLFYDMLCYYVDPYLFVYYGVQRHNTGLCSIPVWKVLKLIDWKFHTSHLVDKY